MSYKAVTVTTTGAQTGLSKPRSDNSVLFSLDNTLGVGLIFTFEASADGSTWEQVAVQDASSGLLVTGGSSVSPADASIKSYIWMNGANYAGFRINVSQLTSGSAAIKYYGSQIPIQPYINVAGAAGSFTNVTATGTLAVTGASTLTGAVSCGSTLAVTGAATLSSTLSCTALTTTSIAATGTVALTDNMTITDAKNIVLNATTGTKIGTATSQKLGFFNAAPVVQQTGTTELVTCLTNLGLLATGAHPVTLNGLLTLTDVNMALGTSTGTIIGTATGQKLGFYGTTAIVQPSGNGTQATSAAGSTTTIFANTTLTGGSGSTAYTVGDVVLCLKKLGLLAA